MDPITVGGTSKLIDRIESVGHCRRVANPDDRRSSIIELTPAGKTLLAVTTITFNQEFDRRPGEVPPRRTFDRLTAAPTRLRTAGRRLDDTNDKDNQP